MGHHHSNGFGVIDNSDFYTADIHFIASVTHLRPRLVVVHVWLTQLVLKQFHLPLQYLYEAFFRQAKTLVFSRKSIFCAPRRPRRGIDAALQPACLLGSVTIQGAFKRFGSRVRKKLDLPDYAAVRRENLAPQTLLRGIS
jgi:hypothetical protein